MLQLQSRHDGHGQADHLVFRVAAATVIRAAIGPTKCPDTDELVMMVLVIVVSFDVCCQGNRHRQRSEQCHRSNANLLDFMIASVCCSHFASVGSTVNIRRVTCE